MLDLYCSSVGAWSFRWNVKLLTTGTVVGAGACHVRGPNSILHLGRVVFRTALLGCDGGLLVEPSVHKTPTTLGKNQNMTKSPRYRCLRQVSTFRMLEMQSRVAFCLHKT